MTIDIKGAFLHANMKKSGVLVHVRIDKTLATILCEIDGVYERFKNLDGTVVVELDKAMYGCIEAARLWYDDLRATFEGMGFTANTEDECVFNRGEGDARTTVLQYPTHVMRWISPFFRTEED